MCCIVTGFPEIFGISISQLRSIDQNPQLQDNFLSHLIAHENAKKDL